MNFSWWKIVSRSYSINSERSSRRLARYKPSRVVSWAEFAKASWTRSRPLFRSIINDFFLSRVSEGWLFFIIVRYWGIVITSTWIKNGKSMSTSIPSTSPIPWNSTPIASRNPLSRRPQTEFRLTYPEWLHKIKPWRSIMHQSRVQTRSTTTTSNTGNPKLSKSPTFID